MSTIPHILLREAVGHVVVVELTTRDEYRGLLSVCEDSMNVMLSKVTHTDRVGKRTSLEQVYLRGSAIRLFVLPDMLTNAPVLKSVAQSAAAAAAAAASSTTSTTKRTKTDRSAGAKRVKRS